MEIPLMGAEHSINGNELPVIVQEKYHGKLVQHENTRQNNSQCDEKVDEAPTTTTNNRQKQLLKSLIEPTDAKSVNGY